MKQKEERKEKRLQVNFKYGGPAPFTREKHEA